MGEESKGRQGNRAGSESGQPLRTQEIGTNARNPAGLKPKGKDEGQGTNHTNAAQAAPSSYRQGGPDTDAPPA